MMAAARSSSRRSTGTSPAAARASTRRAFSNGRNPAATSLCTRHTSSALHTLGRLVLAFSMISTAMFRSAALSTYTWQMPVPVWIQGTVAFSTQARISPAPPRGISRSTRPFAVISSLAEAWVVSSIRLTALSGRPTRARPQRRALTMAWQLAQASRPQRSTQALPAFRASAAASEVTLGRLS